MEPFNEALSQRVQSLSDSVDEETERVVDCRKTVPIAYAQALRRRAEALKSLADAKEELRQQRLRKSKQHARFPAIARGQPLRNDMDAKSRAEATLQSVYNTLQILETVSVQIFPSTCRLLTIVPVFASTATICNGSGASFAPFEAQLNQIRSV